MDALSPAIDDLFSEGLSDDTLLGGAVRLLQPAAGYRVAIDPVALAAAVPALAGQRVLDVGAGSGAVALALATRMSGCRIVGLEIDERMAELARHNARLNGLEGRIRFVAGDLLEPPAEIAVGDFHHVVMNPPYLEARSVTPSANPMRAAANVEGRAKLVDWIAFAFRVVAPRGMISLIHRADRVPEMLAAFGRHQPGGLSLFPLWPRAGETEARRVILRCRVGHGGAFRLARGMTLHDGLGRLTPAALAVLRDAAPIEF